MARIGELIGPNGEVMHPKTSASVVCLEDGRSVEQVLSDDIDYGNVVFQNNSYKFDSDVEDDFAKTVVIKGQTYQNILPEPSTHVLTNNKEMFKVNEGLDPNVEIVDGVSKSAILSGQTLVNGLSNPKKNQGKGYVTIVSPTHLIINHGENIAGEKASVIYEWFGGKMEDGVDYTLDIWILKNTMHRKTDPNASIGKINFNSYNSGFYSIPSNTLGHITYEVTTSKTNTGGNPYIETFTTCEGELEIQMVVRQGRNLEPIEKHFEGMASCKMPVLKATGKNLVSYLPKITVNGLTFTQGESISEVIVNGTCQIDTMDYYIASKDIHSDLSKVLNNAPVGTKFYLSNSLGKNCYFGVVRKGKTETEWSGTNPTTYIVKEGDSDAKAFIRFKQGDTYDNEKLKIQLEVGTETTDYEPYKTNILHAPEEVVLKSINGVKDTLNCNTGEYVQRIKEVVLNGSENWIKQSNGTLWRFVCEDVLNHSDYNEICDKLPTGKSYWAIDETGLYIGGNHKPVIVFNSGDDRYNYSLTQFKEWLSQNPVTVQYKLEVPTIKTVDLSSSGNWERVVLDGSERWMPHSDNGSHVEFKFSNGINNVHSSRTGFSNKFPVSSGGLYERIAIANGTTYITVESTKAKTVEQLQLWLSQNPITVWYQTATTLDSTKVKQPIFFKDGHIIQSSGADNSLIPTLDYQAKTSNSYVMDLMKTNTKYTMKAKSASGTFTIDGTSYGAGTNGTFTTPTSMTNKLLVMSNKTNKEVMILEGDVTSKTIPYFKGIKSAFEGEDKIEVLSQGKNLIDVSQWNDIRVIDGEKRLYGKGWFAHNTSLKMKLPVAIKKGATVYIKGKGIIEGRTPRLGFYNSITGKDGQIYLPLDGNVYTGEVVTSDVDSIFVDFATTEAEGYVVSDSLIISIEPIASYEPYKSNNTKIPLLSPLRSLPNGVCDELIIDRMKKKATLIQRVYEIVLNDKHLGTGNNPDGNLTFMGRWYFDRLGIPRTVYNGAGGINANKMPIIPYGNNIWVGDSEGITIQDYQNQIIDIRVSKSKLSQPNHNGLLKWANDNPIIFQYELETPIITEVDLEGFPYIYKDGHIFLNSEIAPTVGIEYGINQAHRIEGQVETLQRHEKQFTQLERYFADLIYSDYNFALLRFSEKLHQQEGDI